MVEPRVYQFDRQHAHAERLADPLVRGRSGAGAVTGEQGLAAEQRVAGAFVVHAFGQVFDGEPVGGEPGVEDGRLAGADVVTEPAAEEPRPEHEPGVGGEHQVRQARPRRQLFDRGAE